MLLTLQPAAWKMIVFLFICGYLSGSVPYGLILGRLAGLGDIRKSGSGNIGATNALRVGGKALGIATLLLDALKGAVPVLIAKQVHLEFGIIVGLGAFVGHLFPVWLHFKGGKGVAVALGITLALSWQVGAALLVIWLFTAFVSKYSSLSALIAFALAPFIMLCFTLNYELTAFMLLVSVMIGLKHHENIKRLATGKESKINLKKKSAP
jgi:glycerol-3-phosphate acyltransferase PlsY